MLTASVGRLLRGTQPIMRLVPVSTSPIPANAEANPTRRQWVIGGIVLGVGVVAVAAVIVARRRGGAGEGDGSDTDGSDGGQQGTGGGPFPDDNRGPIGGFGGPTGPKGQPQGQQGGGSLPTPPISNADRQAAIAALCSDPSGMRPKVVATLLRGWALPIWRDVTHGELAPSATLITAAKEQIADQIHALCSLPVNGLNAAVQQLADAAEAIDSGSRYAMPIVSNTAMPLICGWDGTDGSPLSTNQSLALLIDLALDGLRKGVSREALQANLLQCNGNPKLGALVLALEIAKAATQIHDESQS